jgi:hypothetical protein
VQSTSRSVKVTFVVAVVVTIAALGTAVALRMVRAERADDGSSTRSSTAVENAAERCGELPCEVLTSVPVGSTTVELLADPDGKHGRLRFRDDNGASLRKTALGDLGVHVTQKSLSCADGPTKACVVRGTLEGGLVGEVFVSRGSGWAAVTRPYFSTAKMIELVQVTDDATPEVVLAQFPDCAAPSSGVCDESWVEVEVFRLDGSSLGCGGPYSSITRIPGWPDIDLAEEPLRSCA